MGEKQNQPFLVSLNAFLKFDFQGSRATPDGGLFLARQLDGRLGLEKPMRDSHANCPNRKFQFRSRAAFVFCLLLFLSKTTVETVQAQSDKGDSQNQTLFLVAHPELPDPIFKESVVLMFPPSVGAANGQVVGLIVNKPARVALSEIFPNDKALKNRSETVYFGGPVDPRAPGVVFRSNKAVKQAALLFDDVYVSFDRDFIKELLKEPGKTRDLHLFVGISQWGPAQLQNEMAMGAWYSVWAETNLIFSASPQSLWRKLLERAEPAPIVKFSGAPFGLSANVTELPHDSRYLALLFLGHGNHTG
jgi:putative transcriptional regulator